jgi:peptidoglycan/xylan/chitin deacetylase (PgdA/CDA1 family)
VSRSSASALPEAGTGSRLRRGIVTRLKRHPAIVEFAARLLCGVGVPEFPARRQRNRLAILMFHGIEPQPLSPSCSHVLDVSTFELKLRYLRRHFDVLPLEEGLERLHAGTLPARAVALTFDDGTRNLVLHAAPVLRSLGLPAAIFLATDQMGTDMALWPDWLWLAFARTKVPSVDLRMVGLGTYSLSSDADRGKAYAATVTRFKDLPDAERIARLGSLAAMLGIEPDADPGPFQLLSWDEARELANGGSITLHPHSATHPILAHCSDDKVEREIADSCQAIESETGSTPTIFAYPNGRPQDFDDRAKAALRRRGIRWALSTTRAFANQDSDPLALPRIASNGSFAVFRLQVSGVLG